MSLKITTSIAIAYTLASIAAYSQPVFAQITPDVTLPSNSIVNVENTLQRLSGGTQVGGNLFHSFEQFNVRTGETALFDNALSIDNIITRVTGGQISNIDGIIRANGAANLFLLNPSGIVFGPNAQLNIGGSFLASTADSLLFENGIIFSAENPDRNALLTVNVPIGLQYGQTVADITVDRANLQVSSAQTLALLGGNLSLNGATLNVPEGRAILGGLTAAGAIGFNGSLNGGSLNGGPLSFPDAIARGNVTLNHGTIVDVTGSHSGSLAVFANDLNLFAGSQLLAGIAPGQTQLDAIAGDIVVNATGNVTLSDRSLINNFTALEALGNGGNVEISANAITLTSGARIETLTQASGNAGKIVLNTNTLDISGFTADGLFSGILTYAEAPNSGTSGSIQVNSPNDSNGTIRLADRGFIATVTNSNNAGGAIGIHTDHLILEHGGQILTLATRGGRAGDITVNARESITMSGSSTQFIPSPFEDIAVFNLDNLSFSTEVNPNVEASGTIPYVSIQRTPDLIVSGNTVLGTPDDRYDYYSFTITQANSRGVFDIDGGNGYSNIPGSLDTEIVLFNTTTGEVLAANDDARETLGGSGSIVNQDAYISTTFKSPGTYVLGVGEFDTVASSLNLLEGDRVDRGDTYTLQVSLENQGTGITQTPQILNPANFNPNYGANSSLASVTEGAGNTGNITLNTDRLTMQSGSEIAATTFAAGGVGDININGATIAIQGATISNITRGSGNAGSILVNAEEVNLNDRGILNVSNFGQGNVGDIRINATHVNLLRGSSLDIGTYNRGNTGDVVINARESVAIDGELDRNRSHIFNLVAGPSAVGNAGAIEINTRRLSLTNGGSLNTTTYGRGNAGDINIQASESIILDGISSNGNGSDLLSRVRGRGQGNAGNISVTTPFFSMTNGARVFNRTEGEGDAGNLSIVAEDIQLSGSEIGSSVEASAKGRGGRIELTADRLSLANLSRITANSAGQGDAGQIFIQASDEVSLSNSTISTAVTGQGQGLGGSLNLEADSVSLRDRAFLTAETVSGRGGNIRLQLNNQLRMQGNSQITATAGTAGVGGDGGNIEINSPLIVALPSENSDITANAFQGAGGNISITTQGLFGAAFREAQTPESDITASSQFGVSGTVAINNPIANTSAGLVELADTPIDPNQQVAVGCAALQGNSFIVTGRGGLPGDPTAAIRGQTLLSDVRDFTTPAAQNRSVATPERAPAIATPVQATGWRLNSRGQVELIAATDRGLSASLSCQDLQ
jgi:filamentous hemagglutinin family protein